MIQSQMLRLRRVIEDMFLLAQADSGGHRPTMTTFYLDEVLLDSIRAGKVLGNARGVEIRLGSIAKETVCKGDEGLLRQLFLILLDNGVKFTAEGGAVDVSLIATEGQFIVRFADTGCGIPPEDVPRIFDRFYRVDKSHSRRHPGAGSGAGLGLAIARWITDQHQGAIRVEKSNETGSVFCVELPATGDVSPRPGGNRRRSARVGRNAPFERPLAVVGDSYGARRRSFLRVVRHPPEAPSVVPDPSRRVVRLGFGLVGATTILQVADYTSSVRMPLMLSMVARYYRRGAAIVQAAPVPAYC